MKKIWPYLCILLLVLTFFRLFFFKGLLPIPADDIVGLYHPFRDLYAATFTRGYPFKNFLITDPVRQQYPWRSLSITLEKQLKLPLWNPYNASGTPLLANQQSAPFYPFNFLFFILPFPLAWGVLIFLQPLLSGWFLFLYLRNRKLETLSGIFGGITFAFCGFAIAWMEWGTILSTLLWLPLLLLCVDKLFEAKKQFLWGFLFFVSYTSCFLAGHLQTFFYLSLVLFSYILLRFLQKKQLLAIVQIVVWLGVVVLVTAIQWIPLFQFIMLSARNVDVSVTPGWFIPWQHLVQFIAPDFFGNPATLNYWSIFNYGEFVGYIGIAPLVLVFYSVFSPKNSIKFFFWGITILGLLFALPTFFANLPVLLQIPFLSTAQPTRLLGIIDFSLSVLAAFGFDALMKSSKRIILPIGIVGVFFVGIWGVILFHSRLLSQISLANIDIAKHNMYLPTILFAITVLLLLGIGVVKKYTFRGVFIIGCLLLLLTGFDLFRFGDKFDPFVSKTYLYPQDSLLTFLSQNIHTQRIMSIDSRILPPNFLIMYNIPSVEVYDPLYIRSYGELIAASERGKPDIHAPFGFNRIITPSNFASPLLNVLGVKYVMSLYPITSTRYKKVFQEGQTIVYQNMQVLPHTFFVKHILSVSAKQEAMNTLFANDENLGNIAVVYNAPNVKTNLTQGQAEIKSYTPNQVIIQTNNTGNGFLVVTDVYYPTWNVTIDGAHAYIYNTDYTFRGVYVPKGVHTVAFSDQVF